MDYLPTASPLAQLFFFLATHVICVVAGVVWARRKGQKYLDAKAAELVAIRERIQSRVDAIPPRVDGALDRAKLEIEVGLDTLAAKIDEIRK